MSSLKKIFFSFHALLAAVLLLNLLMLAGCAPPPKELRPIIWPKPPDVPRIKFVRSFNSMSNFVGITAKDIILGGEAGGGGSFIKPFGLHAGKDGRLFITDTQRGVVEIYDFEKGTVSKVGAGQIDFDNPMSIATDSTNRIFVTDSKRDRIMVFNPIGEFLTSIGKQGEIERPVGLVINEEIGRIYVTDTNKHQIIVFDMKTGEHLFNISQRGQEDGDLNLPTFLTKNEKGDLFVVDFNGRVTVFDQDGRFIRTIGRYGDVSGEFARPKGLAFDSEGHLYVVDAAFNNVQIFNQEGQILLAFSGFGDKRGQMILPAGMTIDSKDQIYVADQWNRKIHVFQYLSEKFKNENPQEWEKLWTDYSKHILTIDTETK